LLHVLTWQTGAALGHASHNSEGTASLSTRWLFAEGVVGAFHTYVALLNPSPRTARLTVTYLGVDGVTPVVREHTIAPDSRLSLHVNSASPELASPSSSISFGLAVRTGGGHAASAAALSAASVTARDGRVTIGGCGGPKTRDNWGEFLPS
jgi:hypothetical protein